MEKFIKKFSETGMKDVADVGGKNASLGEMFTHLAPKGILIPDGFSITTSAFRHFISFNKLGGELQKLMKDLDRKNFSNLVETGARARKLIMNRFMPNDLREAIADAYDNLFDDSERPVAVRSSATAEDLPGASFAGQHDSYLNIKGHYALLYAVKQCFASLYTDRAIKYREDNGFDHNKVFLSVGVQQMVRSDLGSSGVGFTLEPESGFRNVVHIAGLWGLAENIVQGTATPDEFLVFKPSLKKKLKSIIQKNLGSKSKRLIYTDDDDENVNSTINQDTPPELRGKFILEDHEVETLANWALVIEEYYQHPVDFEWAKDGTNHQLYIIQARPGTVHSKKKAFQVRSFKLAEKGEETTTGETIGNMINC
ncbi:MAG TPA: PEP/pyruvate-binding domain-containing protein [Mucilaginibacter sp.]